MLISITLTTLYSVRVVRYLKGFEKSLGISTAHFIAHPVGLIIAWLPSIIFRIAYLSGYYSLWLDAVSIAFCRSSGLINAVIYGWQSLSVKKNKKAEEESPNKIMGSYTMSPDVYQNYEENGNPKTLRKVQSLAIY